MPYAFADEFARFARETLSPAVDRVQARRRSGLIHAALVALGLFAVSTLLVRFSTEPFRSMLDDSQITYWPLLFLAPLAFATVGFCLVYILILQKAVKVFRAELIGSIAEFIDPGLVHERNRPIPAGEMEESLLFGRLAKPSSGPDRFRGRAGGAAVEFSDLQVRPNSGQKSPGLSGLYFVARYPRRFDAPILSFPSTLDVSRSALETEMRGHGYPLAEGMVRLEDPADARQVLLPSGQEQRLSQLIPESVIDDIGLLRRQWGVEVLISAFDNRLHIAMLSANKQLDQPGMFEGFNFGNCRLFCHNARLAMRIAGYAASREGLFENK